MGTAPHEIQDPAIAVALFVDSAAVSIPSVPVGDGRWDHRADIARSLAQAMHNWMHESSGDMDELPDLPIILPQNPTPLSDHLVDRTMFGLFSFIWGYMDKWWIGVAYEWVKNQDASQSGQPPSDEAIRRLFEMGQASGCPPELFRSSLAALAEVLDSIPDEDEIQAWIEEADDEPQNDEEDDAGEFEFMIARLQLRASLFRIEAADTQAGRALAYLIRCVTQAWRLGHLDEQGGWELSIAGSFAGQARWDHGRFRVVPSQEGNPWLHIHP